MKKKFNLNITEPCSEKWNNFKQTSSGGFCSSCQKNVIDFTGLSEQELTSYFKNHNPAIKTCGRFNREQLEKSYAYEEFSIKGFYTFKWFRATVASLALLLFSREGYSQKNTFKNKNVVITSDTTRLSSENIKITPDEKGSYTVSGVVYDEYGEALVGVSIQIVGTSYGTVTNFDGAFSLAQKVNKGEQISFSFIGYESQVVDITEKMPLSINMRLNMFCEILGEVAMDGPYTTSHGRISGLIGRIREWF